MLRPKVLPKLIEQAISNGVRAAFLLNKEGALLASAVSNAPGSDQFQVPVIAAIFSNIWETYTQRPGLEFLLCDCEKGRVCMTQVTDDIYLILAGDDHGHFGMLKRKTQLLKEYLTEPLTSLNQGGS